MNQRVAGLAAILFWAISSTAIALTGPQLCSDFLNAMGHLPRPTSAQDLANNAQLARNELNSFQLTLAEEATPATADSAAQAVKLIPGGNFWLYQTPGNPDAVLRRMQNLGQQLTRPLRAEIISSFFCDNPVAIKAALLNEPLPAPGRWATSAPFPAQGDRREFFRRWFRFGAVSLGVANLVASPYAFRVRRYLIETDLNFFLQQKIKRLQEHTPKSYQRLLIAASETKRLGRTRPAVTLKALQEAEDADFSIEVATRLLTEQNEKVAALTAEGLRAEFDFLVENDRLSDESLFLDDESSWLTLKVQAFKSAVGTSAGLIAVNAAALWGGWVGLRRLGERPPTSVRPTPPVATQSAPASPRLPDPGAAPLEYLAAQIQTASPSADFIPVQWFYVGVNDANKGHADLILKVDRRTNPVRYTLTGFYYRETVTNYWPPGGSAREQFVAGTAGAKAPVAALPQTAQAIEEAVKELGDATRGRFTDATPYETAPLGDLFARIAALKLTADELHALGSEANKVTAVDNFKPLEDFIELLRQRRQPQ